MYLRAQIFFFLWTTFSSIIEDKIMFFLTLFSISVFTSLLKAILQGFVFS